MLHVLTLSWNASDKLTKLKDSLLPALAGIDYQWHIKDNGSTDNTIATVSAWDTKTHLIPYKDNRQNFSAGVNYLFRAATPANKDLILLLNNDVIFNDTTTIAKMQDLLQQDPGVGVVGCRLLYTGTNKLQHAGVTFDPTYKTPMHFRANQVSDALAEKTRQFQAVTGAVLMTRADLFKQVETKNPSGISGLSENFQWAFDDVDLCLSIKYNLGKKIVYYGASNVFHEESASLKKNPINKIFLPHNLNYFFSKWRGRYQIDKDIYTRDPNYNLYPG
jgi:GT2 family glycosyltransferase